MTSAVVDARAHRGHGMPSSVSRSRIASLSWAYLSAPGPGWSSHTLGDEQLEHVRGNVLVVEGHDVTVPGEGVHGIRLGVVPDG